MITINDFYDNYNFNKGQIVMLRVNLKKDFFTIH